MIRYLLRRLLFTAVVLILTSVVTFIIIQLPPGDYLSTLISQMRSRGLTVDRGIIDGLEIRYGLNRPITVQYLTWVRNMFRGDLGDSFQYNRPVLDLVAERIPLTVTISMLTLIFTFVVAIPIAIYSATHQYSAGDYAITFIGFIGLATPNFLLALVLMFVFLRGLGISAGGIFSPEFAFEPWSFAKFVDLLKHLPVPIIVVGTSGTAWVIRVMRATLLDELRRQYVVTARAKGLGEQRLLFRYPVRIALNPIISSMGWVFASIVSGETITAVVLSIPTTGPLLLQALRTQDMYLAGSILYFLTFLTLAGMLISDLVLALADPRIRFEKGAA